MTGANRARYGIPEGADVEAQVRGFARFTKDLRADMAKRLGREPTNEEAYLGHHFGAGRGAATAAGHFNGMAPGQVFTPQEMAGNPHFARHGTMDALSASITGDMQKRFARHGGEGALPQGSQPAAGTTPDFSAFGEAQPATPATDAPPRAPKPPAPVNVAAINPGQMQKSTDPAALTAGTEEAPKPASNAGGKGAVDLKVNTRPGTEIDLSGFGEPAESGQNSQSPNDEPLTTLVGNNPAAFAKPAAQQRPSIQLRRPGVPPLPSPAETMPESAGLGLQLGAFQQPNPYYPDVAVGVM